jgi:hypothetical protein
MPSVISPDSGTSQMPYTIAVAKYHTPFASSSRQLPPRLETKSIVSLMVSTERLTLIDSGIYQALTILFSTGIGHSSPDIGLPSKTSTYESIVKIGNLSGITSIMFPKSYCWRRLM